MPANERDFQLALLAISRAQIRSGRKAIATYNVPRTTLYSRRAGRPSRRDCQPNSKKLTKVEEEAIIKYILDLDLRRFTPNLATIREIANKLLA